MDRALLPLMTFHQGWGTYQRMLVDVVAPLSAEQLEFSVLADKWTVGKTIQHVVASRVWWFQLWMGEGSPELTAILDWDPSGVPEPPKLTASELVAGLTTTWDMIANALNDWTPPDLEEVFSAPKSVESGRTRALRGCNATVDYLACS